MILRHNIDKSKLTDPNFSFDRINRSLSKLESHPSMNIKPVIDRCLLLGVTLIIEERSKKSISYALNRYLELQCANFKKHEVGSQDLEIIIDTTKFVLRRSVDYYADIYFDYFVFLSISNIVKDGMESNCQLDFHKITHNPQRFWQKGIEYLDSICGGDPESHFALLEELEKITKTGLTEKITPGGAAPVYYEEIAEFFKIMWFPIFKLYDYVLHGKTVEFNREMENYVLEKRKYIEEMEINDDQRYWVDYPLLGCCAFAVDHGIEVSVKTEYAPRYVFDRKIT